MQLGFPASALVGIFFVILLVNESEYSKSAGAKPILSPGCIYLASPGAEAGEATFSFPLRPRSAARPHPFFFGGGKKKKRKKFVPKRPGPIFAAPLFWGWGKKDKSKKITISCPKGTDRFSPPWMM
jgi:hypothetical protein